MNLLQRIRVRDLARDAWEKSGHDFEMAQKLFADAQPAGISPTLLAALIELAIRWFMLFRDEKDLLGVGLETD